MGNKIHRLALVFVAVGLLAAESPDTVRRQIIASYQRSLDALSRGDADAAMQMDTLDWTSTTLGQKTRSRQEMEPYIRRDIESLKPPPGWTAQWNPDYVRTGLAAGIQVYDVTVDGDNATVLCLVGGVHSETIEGKPRPVWVGSHVRDTWVRTPDGWKRRAHEKLTINERMVDGRERRSP